MDAKKLEKLLDTGRLLAEQHKVGDSLHHAVQVALVFTQAEYGYLLLHDEDGKIEFYMGIDKDGNRLGKPLERISETIYKQVISSRKAARIAGKVRNLDTDKSTKELQIRSVLCVPLIASGEEFAIILPNMGKARTSVTAEKPRLAIEKQQCIFDERHTVSMTASIDVAESSTNSENFEAILKDADIALYRAKNLGCNSVVSLSKD